MTRLYIIFHENDSCFKYYNINSHEWLCQGEGTAFQGIKNMRLLSKSTDQLIKIHIALMSNFSNYP